VTERCRVKKEYSVKGTQVRWYAVEACSIKEVKEGLKKKWLDIEATDSLDIRWDFSSIRRLK